MKASQRVASWRYGKRTGVTEVKSSSGARGLVAMLPLLLCQQGHAADDIHIWVRAFIPDSVPGLSNTIAEPGPPSRLTMRASDGGCFSTDARSWSSELRASSRLASDFHLLIDEGGEAGVRASAESVHVPAALHVVDCQSGQELAVVPTLLVAEFVGTLVQETAKTQIAMHAAVADPQRPWSSSTINYNTTFTYDRQSRTLDFQVMTGLFPAYEAYATLNDGPVVTVFRSGPFARNELQAVTDTHRAAVELKGSVILENPGKRPKAPTGLTIQ